jgi:hypothetical protein
MVRYILGTTKSSIYEGRRAAKAIAHHNIYYACERERDHRGKAHLNIMKRDVARLAL